MERRDCMKHWLISTNYKRRLVDNEFTPPTFILNAQAVQSFPPTMFLRYLLGIWEFAGFDMKNYVFQKIDWHNSTHQYSAPFQKLFYRSFEIFSSSKHKYFQGGFLKTFPEQILFSVLSFFVDIPQKAVYIYRKVFLPFLSIILANLWLFRLPICSCASFAQFILSSAVSTA